MLNHLKMIATLLLLGTALPALAQDTGAETPEAPATEDTAPVDPAPAEPSPQDPAADLSLGTPVDGEPEVGEPYIRDEFGDWALRCLRAAEGPDPCQLYQLLMDEDDNAVAEISMFPLPDGGQAAAGATIVVPLETLLTEQLTISVDGQAPRRYPFTFCNRAGCVSRVGFTADEVNQFKQGARANLRIVPAAAPDQEVVLDISLIGFTAGYDGTAAVQE